MSTNTNVITSLDGKQTIRINTPSATLTDSGDANSAYMTVEVDGEEKQVLAVYALGLDGGIVDVRAANKDLGWDLDNFFIHLKGDPNAPVNGDFRIFWDGEDMVPQTYNQPTLTWIPTGIKTSVGTLRLGAQVGVTGAGSSGGFSIRRDEGVLYGVPAIGLTREGVTFPMGYGFPIDEATKVAPVNGTDNIDAVLVGGRYRINDLTTEVPNAYIFNQYLTVGDTAPTARVCFEVWEDTAAGDEDKLIVRHDISVDEWDGKVAGDEILFNFSEDGIEESRISTRAGAPYFVEYSSTQPFSLYGAGASVNRSFDLQNIVPVFLANDEWRETSTATIHNRNSNYVVDSTTDPVAITIPFGTLSGFTVWDAKKQFQSNSCFIYIKDAGDITVHTVELNKKGKAYQFYYNPFTNTWKYAEIGSGEFVDISGTNTASVDFPVATNFMKAHLSTDMTINTAEATIPFDTVDGSEGVINSAGEFTVRDAGLYAGALSVFVEQSGMPTINFWMEYKPLGGSWTLATDSLFERRTFSDTSTAINISTSIELLAGTSIRIKINREGTTASLQGRTQVVNLGTVYQRSAKISFHKVEGK